MTNKTEEKEKRQKKLNSSFLEQINQVMRREVELPENILVTISHVKCAANLDSVKIFISCLPEDKTEEIIKKLQESSRELALILDKDMHFSRLPKLIFKADFSQGFGEKTEELIDSLI